MDFFPMTFTFPSTITIIKINMLFSLINFKKIQMLHG